MLTTSRMREQVVSMNDTLSCDFWDLLIDLPFVSRMESPTEFYRNTGNLESIQMPSLISSLPCLSQVTTYTAFICIRYLVICTKWLGNSSAPESVSSLHHASFPSWGPLHSRQLYICCFVHIIIFILSSGVIVHCVQLVAPYVLQFKMDMHMGKASSSFLWINNVSQAWTIFLGAWPCVMHLSMVISSHANAPKDSVSIQVISRKSHAALNSQSNNLSGADTST